MAILKTGCQVHARLHPESPIRPVIIEFGNSTSVLLKENEAIQIVGELVGALKHVNHAALVEVITSALAD